MRIALPAAVSPAAVSRLIPGRAVATLAGEALGTTWGVRYVVGAAAGDALRRRIARRLDGIADEMSQWRATSLLSRFNASPAGRWHSLPPDFAEVLAAALDVASTTGGAFDPTHGRAAGLLGYGAEAIAGRPTAAMLDAAFADAGWRRLAFDRTRRQVRQPGGLWLDLSGIGKGYAVDAVADLLAGEGIHDALVEIGGELAGRGLKPDGTPWWVDLEPPPGLDVPPLRLGLHEAAVATSGDYVRGPHTLDPRTGRPLARDVVSVSVVHPRAMLADAWATALTVLGAERGLAMAREHGLAARIVGQDGTERISPTLADMLGR